MSGLTITLLIVLITGLVSYRAFQNSAIYEKLLYNPYQVKHRKEYYRLLSHVLVHADWMHLALNLFVLYSFGIHVEAYMKMMYGKGLGSFYYVLLYVLGAVVASLPGLRKHGDNYGYNAVGASGAVSAVMIAAMILNPISTVAFFFVISMPAYVGIIVFFVIEHVMNRSGKTNIAHDAHIWGAILGIVFILALDYHMIERFFEQVIAHPWGR